MNDAGPGPPVAHAVAELATSSEVRRHLFVPNTGVIIVQHDGHVVWASPSIEKVVGRSPADLVGRNAWELFVFPEDVPRITAFKVRLNESDGIVWGALRMPTGPPLWCRVEAGVRKDHILCAFRVERDQAEWHPHFVLRPRPAPAKPAP